MVPTGRAEYSYRVIGSEGILVIDINAAIANRVAVYTLDGRRIAEHTEPSAPKGPNHAALNSRFTLIALRPEVDDNLWSRGTALLFPKLAELLRGDHSTLLQRTQALSYLVPFEEGTVLSSPLLSSPLISSPDI